MKLSERQIAILTASLENATNEGQGGVLEAVDGKLASGEEVKALLELLWGTLAEEYALGADAEYEARHEAQFDRA